VKWWWNGKRTSSEFQLDGRQCCIFKRFSINMALRWQRRLGSWKMPSKQDGTCLRHTGHDLQGKNTGKTSSLSKRKAVLLINYFASLYRYLNKVLWRCWLGIRKSNQAVKIEQWGISVVICLERGADCLYMVQLMPLHPRTLSSLALINPDWFQLSDTGILEKRLLIWCSSGGTC